MIVHQKDSFAPKDSLAYLISPAVPIDQVVIRCTILNKSADPKQFQDGLRYMYGWTRNLASYPVDAFADQIGPLGALFPSDAGAGTYSVGCLNIWPNLNFVILGNATFTYTG